MPLLQFLAADADLTSALGWSYEPRLVVLSFVVATLAAYAALGLASRIVAADTPAARRNWLAAGAVAMGVGIWAMHFIGMLAVRMDPPASYDLALTLWSIVPAVVASAVALWVTSRPRFEWRFLLVGGVLMGLGIGAMHYTGMAAMRMAAELRYDPALFGLSIVVAASLSVVALWSHDRAMRSVTSLLHWTKLWAALVMGFAVAGMHYTGMAAAVRFAVDLPGEPLQVLDPRWLAVWVGTASFLVLGLAVLVVVVDTRLQAAASVARATRRQMFGALESMSDAFSLWDAEGRLEICNSRYRSFYPDLQVVPGVTYETLVRAALESEIVRIPPQDRAGWVAERLHLFHTSATDVLERTDGTWLQISRTQAPSGETIMLYTDITGVKHAETEMRKRGAQLSRQALEARVLHQVSETAADAGSLEEALAHAVGLVCSMTGWPVGHVYEISREDSTLLTPTRVWHLSNEEEFQVFRDVTERTTFKIDEGLPGRILRSGEPAWIVDVQADSNFPRNRLANDLGVKGACGFPVKVRDHVVAVLEFFAREQMDPDEAMMRIMRAVGDQLGRVFERRQAAEALQQAREAAEAANRSKSQFLSNMSHELRTPLNGVLGYTQILQRDPRLSAVHRESLEAIEHCGEHLLELINDVLDFSRIESGKIDLQSAPCDLPRVLAAVCDIVRPHADAKGLTLTLVAAPDLPRAIRIDQPKLRQVLVNLLGNAVKFTEQGGVTLDVSERPPAALLFTVRDTGVGIPLSQIDEIFDAFRQADAGKASEGTGLGLAISRRLIEAMGGSLTVKSDVGQGSAFTATLPLVEEDEAMLETPDEDRHPEIQCLAPGQEVAVLVADDRQTNRDILVRLLQGAGFTTDEAENGREALEKLRAGRFSLVLMDIRMPVMGGLEATRVIRSDPALKDMVVIGVSASVFPDSEQRIVEAGCNDFLTKPLRASELFGKIGRHLGVSFVHPAAASSTGTETAALPPERASQIAQRLRAAVGVGDVSELDLLAAELRREPSPGPHYGDTIGRLTRAFDFDGLLRLAADLDQADGTGET